MKHLIIIFFGLIVSTGFAQTQSELNKEKNDSFMEADRELNEIYKKILSEYKSDSLFVNNLKVSQRIWITFRDAELKMKYPDREPEYYGSVHPMCISMYLEYLTRERIKTLKVWLDGIEEGDACNGSVKIKNN
jgi:uncharacterized protein YecT (DUF1311 family)